MSSKTKIPIKPKTISLSSEESRTNNTIIRKKRDNPKTTKALPLNQVQSASPLGQVKNVTIIRKRKPLAKVNQVEEVEINANETKAPKSVKQVVEKLVIMDCNPDDLPEMGGAQMIKECFNILNKHDPKANLSKEELIEKVEDQLDALLNNKAKYSKSDFEMKETAIRKILKKLKEEFIDEGVAQMEKAKVKIIESIKKIPKKQFKAKIDLTNPEKTNDDPTYHLLVDSRELHKKSNTYRKLSEAPIEVQKIAPKKDKGFQNAPMPANLLSQINFR